MIRLRKLDIGSSDSSIVAPLCSNQSLPNLVSFAGTFLKVLYCVFCSTIRAMNLYALVLQVDDGTFKTIAFVLPKLQQLTIRHFIESAVSCQSYGHTIYAAYTSVVNITA